MNSIVFTFKLPLFGKDKLDCKRLYPTLSTKDANVGVKFLELFSVKFEMNKERIQQGSEITILMDNFQFEKCKEAESYRNDSKEREYYRKMREQGTRALQELQVTLITCKMLSPKERDKQILESLSNLRKVLRYDNAVEERNQVFKEYPVKEPMLTMLGGV